MNFKKLLFFFIVSFVLVSILNAPKQQIKPLQIQATWCLITIKDANTNTPISNVNVEFWTYGFQWYGETTDINGQIYIGLGNDAYWVLKCTHGNYEYKEETIYVISHYTNYFTIQLTPLTSPTQGYSIAFYLRDSRNQVVEGAQYITFRDKEYLVSNGKLVLYNVPQGNYQVRFRGVIYVDVGNTIPYDFTLTVSVTENKEYTIICNSGEGSEGVPPIPPPTPLDLLSWLLNNLPLVVLGAVGLYALPHVVKLLEIFKRKS